MHNLPTIPKDKEFIKFCNSLRCPLCGSQLDGNIHPKKAALYCATNNDEYVADWSANSTVPTQERINYYYGDYQYEILTVQGTDNYHTVIYKINLSLNKILRYAERKKIFEMVGPRLIFFRKRMEEKEFLNKIKLYNVFS
jgi:hypothetical protein